MEESNIKISVIMGVYNMNNRKILEQAVYSILNQTFTNFEFIICDDGSTDNTFSIISDITCHNEKVILIRNERNLGLAASLNHCLSIAKGKYIARMDADDFSYYTRLEEEYNFLEENLDYAFVGCLAELIEEKGIWGRRKLIKAPKVDDLLYGNPFMHPTVMFRKDALESVNGYRESKMTLRTEDYDLFMRLYANGLKGYNIQKYLFQFREDNNAYKRKKYKYRIDEAKIRYINFKILGLMPKGYLYMLKPLIVGLVPPLLVKKIRREEILEEILK